MSINNVVLITVIYFVICLFILLQTCIQRHKGQHRTRITNIILTQIQRDNEHKERQTKTIQINLENVDNLRREEKQKHTNNRQLKEM